MTEENTIDSNSEREETKEKAKKESKRAIRKRKKEEERARLEAEQQKTPVATRTVTREAYKKKKDYKEALEVQAAELYKIDEIYKVFAQRTSDNTPASKENLAKSNIGDIISIQHTDKNGNKTFSPPMEIRSRGVDKEGNEGYYLVDMQGNAHFLANKDAEVVPIMTESEKNLAYQKGKDKVEKADLGPKKLQQQVTLYQDRIAEAHKATSAWKDDYLKAPEKPKEQETGGKVKITLDDNMKAVVEKCPYLISDFIDENNINRDGLGYTTGTKAENSAKLSEWLQNKEFDKEQADKLTAYLSGEQIHKDYKEKPLKCLTNINVMSTDGEFACNAVPTNVQKKMKDLGIIPEETKWMNSKALMNYMKEGDNLTFTQERLDQFCEYIQDKKGRQADFIAYKNQSRGGRS